MIHMEDADLIPRKEHHIQPPLSQYWLKFLPTPTQLNQFVFTVCVSKHILPSARVSRWALYQKVVSLSPWPKVQINQELQTNDFYGNRTLL